MIIKPRYRRQLKSIVLLSIILVTSISALVFPTNLSNNPAALEDNTEDSEDLEDILGPVEEPKTSVLGNKTWWNQYFKYRRVISITNRYGKSFTDFGARVSFDYTEFGSDIQGDLDDIRIVENGIERTHYTAIDFPESPYATVWFDTNISAGPGWTESDVYMYYGNSTVDDNIADEPDESFGWVRNGDFELDISTEEKYIPFGWNFTDDPVDNVYDPIGLVPQPISGAPGTTCSYNEPHNYTDSSYENFEYKVIADVDVKNQEGIGHGSYAYKFGSPASSILNGDGTSGEYVGTLYSLPFTVPIINDGTGPIELNIWRNVRTHVFEDTPGGEAIVKDGYWLRICNYTPALYGYDVDDHENGDEIGYTNYIELYGGDAHLAGQNYKEKNNMEVHYTGDVKDTGDPAQLTGNITFDLSDYMGKEIFLEMGTWGEEDGYPRPGYPRCGFFQMDIVQFNYTLVANLEEKQKQRSDIEIVAKDVDGRLVPNVEIFIVNESARGQPGFIIDSDTAPTGSKLFENVLRGKYNITVNYTLGSNTEEVFNSTKDGTGPYYFNGIDETIELTLDIWTIDFEIVDNDGNPMPYGKIQVRESQGGPKLINLSLDSNGKATFRWRNTTRYYFEVYYTNSDYANHIPLLLNESYIYRSDYLNNMKQYTHALDVNRTNTWDKAKSKYNVAEYIYTNGSKTEFGNQKLISVDITLANMIDYLENVSIYYIDKYNEIGTLNENRIYFDDDYGPGADADNIQIDIMTSDNPKLAFEDYYAYGLYIVINGVNFSGRCDGIITIDTVETCNAYNKTTLAKLNLRLVQKSDIQPQGAPLTGAIYVMDNTTKTSLVDLKAYSDRDGYAFGQTNDVEFWYLIGTTLNFSLQVANYTYPFFNMTDNTPNPNPNNQWGYEGNQELYTWYNYTHVGFANLTFNVIFSKFINISVYDTTFNQSYGDTNMRWGEYMTFWAEFWSTDDNWKNWEYIDEPPGTCTLVIKVASGPNAGDIVYSKKMNWLGNGIFNITVNSSKLSAGYDKKYYNVEIQGFHPTYNDPNPASYLITVRALQTGISAIDDDFLIVADNKYTQNWAINVNITIRYYSSSGAQPSLKGATCSYDWLLFGATGFGANAIDDDYYTLSFNTSLAGLTGLYPITINASLENHTSRILIVSLKIKPRAATLNNLTGFVYISKGIWIQDRYNFVFEYRDYLTGKRITNLGVRTYTWQKTTAEGIPLPQQGSGDLTPTASNDYVLDFKTETRAIGNYILIVTLQKENYESVNAFINLVIYIRGFDAELETNNLDDDLISVVHGEEIDFEVTVLDTSRGIPLEGATVKIEIGDNTHDMDEDSPGVYKYTFETDDVDAFFTSKTYTVTITIEKFNFEDDEIEVTVVVQMEEIFDGMPTFYFIMIVSAISAVVGALVGYRVIQQARIPNFVKKVRSVKKSIKSKSSAPSISIPTKNKMFLKQFSKDWKDIGINLSDILGIEETKTTLISKAKDLIKQKGGAD